MAGELELLKARQLAAATVALRAWMEHVVGEAQRDAPIEEGTLRGSGSVDVELVPGGVNVTGSFSTVYAARQHEELGWKHPRGGKAKYLEEPFKANLPRVQPLVGAAVARVT